MACWPRQAGRRDDLMGELCGQSGRVSQLFRNRISINGARAWKVHVIWLYRDSLANPNRI